MALIWHKEFRQLCDEDPTRQAFVFYNEALEMSCLTRQEVWTYASRFADKLKKCGLKRGDVVMCAVPVSPEAAIINVGVYMAGGTAINSEVVADSSDLFLHCVNKSQAKYLVMRNEPFDLTYHAFRSGIDKGDTTAPYATVSDGRIPSVKRALFVTREGTDNFMEKLKHQDSSFIDLDIDEEQVAAIFMTSGTTGMPKLVMRSHRSLVIDGREELIPSPCYPKLREAKRFYHNAPWSWVVSSTFDILGGYTRVQSELWVPLKNAFRTYANIIKKDNVRFMFLTPPELQSISKVWDMKGQKVADLLFVAGFPVTKQLLEWILTMTESTLVRYGGTELCCISYNCIDHISEFKDFDTGILCKATQVKAVNEKMEEVPSGVPGRLLAKSLGVFSGYMGEEDKTKEALTSDGWFITSDAGYVSRDNHLIIIGRYDYVIRHNGQTIYPAVVEKPIREHLEVTEVVIVPVPNVTGNDDICAFVVKQVGSTLSESDVIYTVAQSRDLAGNRIVPPQHVIFLDSIEKSSRGKINRNQLIEMAVQKVKG